MSLSSVHAPPLLHMSGEVVRSFWYNPACRIKTQRVFVFDVLDKRTVKAEFPSSHELLPLSLYNEMTRFEMK